MQLHRRAHHTRSLHPTLFVLALIAVLTLLSRSADAQAGGCRIVTIGNLELEPIDPGCNSEDPDGTWTDAIFVPDGPYGAAIHPNACVASPDLSLVPPREFWDLNLSIYSVDQFVLPGGMLVASQCFEDPENVPPSITAFDGDSFEINAQTPPGEATLRDFYGVNLATGQLEVSLPTGIQFAAPNGHDFDLKINIRSTIHRRSNVGTFAALNYEDQLVIEQLIPVESGEGTPSPTPIPEDWEVMNLVNSAPFIMRLKGGTPQVWHNTGHQQFYQVVSSAENPVMKNMPNDQVGLLQQNLTLCKVLLDMDGNPSVLPTQMHWLSGGSPTAPWPGLLIARGVAHPFYIDILSPDVPRAEYSKFVPSPGVLERMEWDCDQVVITDAEGTRWVYSGFYKKREKIVWRHENSDPDWDVKMPHQGQTDLVPPENHDPTEQAMARVQVVANLLYREYRDGLRIYNLYNRWGQLSGFRDTLGREVWLEYGEVLTDEWQPNRVGAIVDEMGRRTELEYDGAGWTLNRIILPPVTKGAPDQSVLDREIKVAMSVTDPLPLFPGQDKPVMDGSARRCFMTGLTVAAPMDDPLTPRFEATLEPYAWLGVDNPDGSRVSSVKYEAPQSENPSWMASATGGTTTYVYCSGFQKDCNDQWVEEHRPDGSVVKHDFDIFGNETTRTEPLESGGTAVTEFRYEGMNKHTNTVTGTVDPMDRYSYVIRQHDAQPGAWHWYDDYVNETSFAFFDGLNVLEEGINTTESTSGAYSRRFEYASRYNLIKKEWSPGEPTIPDYTNFYDFDDASDPEFDPGAISHPGYSGTNYQQPVRGALIKTRYRESQVTCDAGPDPSVTNRPRDVFYAYNDFAQPTQIWDGSTADDALRETRHTYHLTNDPDGDGGENWGVYLGGYTNLPGYPKQTEVEMGVGQDDLVSRFEYDSWGNPTESTDPRGIKTYSRFNEMNQAYLVATGDVDEPPESGGYATLPAGQAASIQYVYFDDNGNATESRSYNDNEKTASGTSVTDFITTQYVYDGLDQVVEVRNELVLPEGTSQEWLSTRWVRDSMGRIVREIRPDLSASEVQYTPRGQIKHRRDHAVKYGPSQSIMDPLSPLPGQDRTMDIVYNDAGQVLTMENAEDTQETLYYDDYGRLAGKTGPLGTLLEHDLNDKGLVEKATLYEAGTAFGATGGADVRKQTEFDYDPLQRLSLKKDFWFDADGDPVQVDPLKTRFTYSVWGELIAVQDARDHRTNCEYDDAGRRTKVWYPGLGAAGDHRNLDEMTYDANSNVTQLCVKEHVPGGSPVSYTIDTEFDSLNRPNKVTQAKGLTEEAESRTWYDSLGNVVQTVVPTTQGAIGSRCRLDTLGRVVWSREGYVGDSNDASGSLCTTSNDDGWVTLLTTFDVMGNVLSRTDDRGNTTGYVYDALQRPIRTNNADGTYEVVSYRRDNLLDVFAAFAATGVRQFTIDYTYDQNKPLLVQEDYDVESGPYTGLKQKAYDQDDQGRVIEAQAISEHPVQIGVEKKTRTEREYDSFNRIVLDRQQFFTSADGGDTWAVVSTVDVNHEFDEVGNVTETTSSAGYEVLRQFDEVNRPVQVEEGTAYHSTNRIVADLVWRGARGRLHEITHSWPTTDTTTLFSSYDTRGRVGEIRTEDASLTLLSGRQYAYGLNSVWEHELKMDPVPMGDKDTHFTHDALDRLIQIHTGAYVEPTGFTPPFETEHFTFDGVGNITRHDLPGGTSHTNQTDALNAYVNTFDAETHSRDERGNVTEVGVMNLAYDVLGHIVATLRPYEWPIIPTFEFRDAFDRRVYRNINGQKTIFVHSGDELIQEVDFSTGTAEVAREYIHGAGIDHLIGQRIDGRAYAFHVDQKGTPFAATNPSGTIEERYAIDPWGNVEVIDEGMPDELGNRIGLAGMWYDDVTNLYYMRGRHYSPFLKRFTSRDPLGIWGDLVNRGNAYGYVGNSATKYVDPTGLGTLEDTCKEELNDAKEERTRLEKEREELFSQHASRRLEKEKREAELRKAFEGSTGPSFEDIFEPYDPSKDPVLIDTERKMSNNLHELKLTTDSIRNLESILPDMASADTTREVIDTGGAVATVGLFILATPVAVADSAVVAAGTSLMTTTRAVAGAARTMSAAIPATVAAGQTAAVSSTTSPLGKFASGVMEGVMEGYSNSGCMPQSGYASQGWGQTVGQAGITILNQLGIL